MTIESLIHNSVLSMDVLLLYSREIYDTYSKYARDSGLDVNSLYKSLKHKKTNKLILYNFVFSFKYFEANKMFNVK